MKSNLLPCGKCDMGTYSEPAMLNKKARAFCTMSVQDRLNRMPACKTHERACRGAIELHNMICIVDEIYPDDGKASAVQTKGKEGE